MIKALASIIFNFFASSKTPNSSFYVTAGTIVASLTTVLTASNNPWLMGIGAVVAAVYTLSHNYAEARKSEAAALAFSHSLNASIRLAVPELTASELTPEQASAVKEAAATTPSPTDS